MKPHQLIFNSKYRSPADPPKDPRNMLLSHMDKVRHAIIKKDISSAENLLKGITQLLKSVSDEGLVAEVENIRGCFYHQISNFPEAVTHWKKSIELAKTEEIIETRICALINMATAYFEAGNKGSAEKYFDSAVNHAFTLNNGDMASDILDLMVEYQLNSH